ncbi:MAG: serine/threonine-protein kinase [Sphingomonas bacterium]
MSDQPEVATRKLTGAEWAQVRTLFDMLLDLPPAKREARLTAPGVDRIIADELRSLFASDRQGVLDGAPPTLAAAEPAPEYASLASGAVVGAFRIDRLIGRGGMGEVYLAHRDTADFVQSVALKMLRPEAAGRAELFDAERRLLAGLEHPGIARLIDGGIAPDGRPYMAVEYVEGREISRWCAEEDADLPTRLNLFLELCDAVVYAHGRLVIHRDLKPANILVDCAGRTRLLDFGVAKLLDTTVMDPSTTQALLTPDYAAPEQFEGVRPTVATDIYSLGAVLFELLAGRGPWRFDDSPLPTVLRRLLHDDPPWPSAVAAVRKIPAAKIVGDLDAIVLKAMRRAPDDRYTTANALADDVRRYLAIEPVRARTGAASYIFRRFVRRHRWGTAATSAGLLALLVGAGGIAWQARQTRVERDIAVAQAERSEAINQAVLTMFRDAGDAGIAPTANARDLIAGTATRLVNSLDPAAPESDAVIGALSDLYVMTENSEGSQKLLETALARGIGRNDRVGTAQLKLKLAPTYAAAHRDLEARALLAQADAIWRTDPDRFRVERVEAVGVEAMMLRQEGKHEEGLALLQRNMPDAERALAGNGRDLATRYANLTLHLIEAGRADEAEALLKRSEAKVASTGQQNSPAALQLLQLSGVLAARRGDIAAAATIFGRTAATRRSLYGPSTGLAADLMQYARALNKLGKPAEALSALDEAQPMTIKYAGTQALPTLMVGMSRAEALIKLGRLKEAEADLNAVTPGMIAAGPEGLLNGARLEVDARLAIARRDFRRASTSLDHAETIFRKIGAPAAVFAEGVAPLRREIQRLR